MHYSDQARIISIREAMSLTSLSRSTLWRMQQKNNFPKRITLSANRVGFRERDVLAWIAERGEG